MAKVCASCGAALDDNELFCMKCGTPIDQNNEKEESRKFCPQCGNVLEDGAIFCDVCGRETERAKQKKEEPAPDEPAVMEGILSPSITDETFAGARDLNKEKFDGFEAAEDHAVRKDDNDQSMKPKATPLFEMDAAALPELKPKPANKPKQEQPAPQKKEVTAETIKNSNPYGDFAAKSGGRTIQTAKESAPAPQKSQSRSKPEPPKPQPAPEKPKAQTAPPPVQRSAGPTQSASAVSADDLKKQGIFSVVEKIRNIFAKN